MTTWHHFARWEHAPDFLRLGWVPSSVLADTHHEQYAVVMHWLCDCKPATPAYLRRRGGWRVGAIPTAPRRAKRTPGLP